MAGFVVDGHILVIIVQKACVWHHIGNFQEACVWQIYGNFYITVERVLIVYFNEIWNPQNVGKLSAHANSGYQALFLLPLESLGTRI